MRSKPRLSGVVLTVTLVFILAGAPLAPKAAQASYEDAAIFYDELAPHGSWVDYEQYGPVWYPSQVEQDWRPYTNGRWTPSEQGYLFETAEPWGWATYHYGNWMPTEHYGWVWVPGRTWYPNTVAWRHSPENTPQDLSYIGWAPIPPPNFAPQPGLFGGYPGGYGGYPGGYGGYPGGYPGYSAYPGVGGGALSLLSAPFWIFAQATKFLLGFGQPYSPAYSYYGSGILAPPTYVQVIYPATTVVRDWYYPSYYQPSYFGSGTALGAYSWGPPTRYVSHVTNINYITINEHKRRVHVNNVRGGWPDDVVFKRNPYLRRVVPSENPRNWSRPMEVRNVDAAARHLGNPRAIVKPAELRPLPSGRIPKASAVTAERRPQRRVFEVPQRAQQRFTPQMEQRIRSLRPASEGSAAQGRGPGRPQTGFVGSPETPQRRGGQPEGFQRPGAQDARRGPAATPATPATRATPAVPGGPGTRATRAVPATPATPATPPSPQGMRRGPVEVDRQPEGYGVRRGPGAVPESSQGVRRGPAEGFQRPGPQDARRGPAVTPATPATRATPAVPGGPGTRATRAVPATPATPATPASPQGVRRGSGEGFQAPEQQRRQQLQPQQIRQEQQQRQRFQQQSPRQIEPQQRLQMQQQMRQQQEEQRRQQLQQQQMRQRQDQQQRQSMQQQQLRQQQEQRQRQQQQLEQQRPQQVQQQRVRQQPQQVRQQQSQPRQQQVRQQQSQPRQQQVRQQQSQPRQQQVRQQQSQPRQQQVRAPQERSSRESQRQPGSQEQRAQRSPWVGR
jgi:hypothetical protein